MNVIPLVNWGMGATIIGVFAVVCVILTLVIFSMVNSGKKEDHNSNEEE